MKKLTNTVSTAEGYALPLTEIATVSLSFGEDTPKIEVVAVDDSGKKYTLQSFDEDNPKDKIEARENAKSILSEVTKAKQAALEKQLTSFVELFERQTDFLREGNGHFFSLLDVLKVKVKRNFTPSHKTKSGEEEYSWDVLIKDTSGKTLAVGVWEFDYTYRREYVYGDVYYTHLENDKHAENGAKAECKQLRKDIKKAQKVSFLLGK